MQGCKVCAASTATPVLGLCPTNPLKEFIRMNGSETLIHELNTVDRTHAMKLISPLIELSPWLVDRLVDERPFADADELADCLAQHIRQLTESERRVLARAHPELAPGKPDTMTDQSQKEQGRLGIAQPSDSEARNIRRLNARYRDRFGFPYIIALHSRNSITEVLENLERRLTADTNTELETMVDEVISVARERVRRLFGSTRLDCA